MRSGLATGFNVFDLLPWDILPTSLKGSMEVSTNLHGSFHGSRFISMEEKLSRWKLPWKSVEVDLLIWKSVETSMHVHGSSAVDESGSFYCFHQLHLPRTYSAEASMSLDIPLHTAAYFHEYLKLPSAFARLPWGSTDFRSIYFHGIFHQLPWKPEIIFRKFHGNFPGSKFTSMKLGGSRFISMKISVEVDESRFTSMWVSGSRKYMGVLWKLPWNYMEVSIFGRSGSFHCYRQLRLSRIHCRRNFRELLYAWVLSSH